VSTSVVQFFILKRTSGVLRFQFFKKNWRFLGCGFKPGVLPILKSGDSHPNTFLSNSRTSEGLVQMAMASTSMPLLSLMASPSSPIACMSPRKKYNKI
jgi:hypothetical protein